MSVENTLETLFQNNHTDSISDYPSNDIHESDSDISINTDCNEKLRSQHVHYSIISQPVLYIDWRGQC